MPTPATKAALVGKATVVIVSTLSLAAHALWARPFAPAHAWKGPVRAALLVLAAASAAIIAWAGALDLRIQSGPEAHKALTAGSYALAVLFGCAIALLIASVTAAMMRGVQEKGGSRLPLKESRGRATVIEVAATAVDLGPLPNDNSVLGTPAPRPDLALATVAASADPVNNVGFAVVPIRQRQGSCRQRRRESRRHPSHPPLRDPALTDAASTLADAAASEADVVRASEAVASTLERLSVTEARAASSALLPSLSARLETALSSGAACDSAVVEAVCQAMAALSDHADASTLSRLIQDGAPAQIAALLRRCVDASANRAPRVLSHALWLLGNMVSEGKAAAAFAAAGGAGLLVSVLLAAHANSVLHACVAIASLSAHAEAASSLIREGVISALVRCVLPQHGPVTPALLFSASSQGGGLASRAANSSPEFSLADAEAACRALAIVLGHCAASETDAVFASSELAAGRAIAGCTAALRRASGVSGSFDPLLADLSAHAADALLGIAGCASAAAATADAGGSSAAASMALAAQAAEEGTEAAVRALAEAVEAKAALSAVEADGVDATRAGLRRSLAALAAALRPWLSSIAASGSA